jgi:hypothetical protein
MSQQLIDGLEGALMIAFFALCVYGTKRARKQPQTEAELKAERLKQRKLRARDEFFSALGLCVFGFCLLYFLAP